MTEYADVGVHVRWMIRRDLPEVLAIEDGAFEVPWQEDDFVRCLQDRSLQDRNCIGMVAEKDGNVVGFMVYELHERHLDLLNFAVGWLHRREGIGRAMMDNLISKLSRRRRTRITLHVRETNLVAQQFFRACGFRAVSIVRGFWEGTPEDAYVMHYDWTEDS